MLEILAPAGNLECALAAINSGADAVYLGLASSFSARQGADNFDAEAFREIIRRAHLFGKKVYVAMNTLVKTSNDEMNSFIKDLLFAWEEGADAIILQDAFLAKRIHEAYPEIVLHMSTQAGICNIEGAKFAKECGFSRVILARETPLSEIKEIASFIETEVFVQGALCTCFSGQCYFSSFAGGNSGNRGRCKQPCRKLYSYNRKGHEEKSYALSLSDLCVGEYIEKLIDIGVASFKIEGRMRRAEYVAASVQYYRALLDNSNKINDKLSDLRRTYNRGNYTKGLAFGQDKRFLSTAIQGHLGEKVGVVKVVNGKYFVESQWKPSNNDAFKILRDGKEVAGAIFSKIENRGFTIFSKIRLKNGDSVFITTDNALNSRLLSKECKLSINLELSFVEGEKALALWNGVTVYSDAVLQTAQKCPLSKEEVIKCFDKTDNLPIDIVVNSLQIIGDIFIPKSDLNAFRRKVFQQIMQSLTEINRENLVQERFFDLGIKNTERNKHGNNKVAVIADAFDSVTADIAIYKWNNLLDNFPQSFVSGNFEKYIYYPAFLTGEDIQRIADLCKQFNLDGIYADNYGGIAFAQKHNCKLFAGTGFNLTNEYSIDTLLSIPNVEYYCVSKELNEKECGKLNGEKAFLLSSGDIKIMDLCYCPFGKTCKDCDKKAVYQLTDENGRMFPVRRYTSANGECRFEVYNCASLISDGVDNMGKLLDLTLIEEKAVAIKVKDDEEGQKKIYQKYTSGHFKRGIL